MFSLKFFTIIPEKSAFIVERFGKFHQILNPGLNWLVPVLDRIAYRQSLKEESISIEKQQVITKDNVTISIDGMLFIQVDDPYKASYQVEKPHQAVRLLCLTILRSEIGKMKLDQLLQERGELNKNLFKAVNQTAQGWGLKCNSVEILQIDPPDEIKKSMQFQASAERLKRRDILKSEGNRVGEINLAEGKKISMILKAEGESESVKLRSEAESESLKQIGEAINKTMKNGVVDYILLSNYVQGYQSVLEKSNVVVVPKGSGGDSNGSSNDLISLAGYININIQIILNIIGMMLFSNQQNRSNWPILEQVQQKTQKTKIQKHENPNEEPLSSYLKKNVFYDDINLYSSGDEESKGQQSKSTNQK